MRAQVELVYRLDFNVDLFATSVAGVPIVVDLAELELIREAIADVHSCWSDPTDAQIQAAVVSVLGRDPRD